MAVIIVALCLLAVNIANEYSPEANKFLRGDFTKVKVKNAKR